MNQILGKDADGNGVVMEEEIDRIVRACLDLVYEDCRLTPAERRLSLATVIRRLQEALWMDLKNDVLKEQIGDARSRGERP